DSSPMNSRQQANPEPKERSVFRLSTIADEPVYLLLTMDGVKIDPIVDELGGGGARIVCAKDFDRFDEGQIVGAAVLVLQDERMPVVYPVVNWKRWPVIGLEFMGISGKARKMILRVLCIIELRMIRQ